MAGLANMAQSSHQYRHSPANGGYRAYSDDSRRTAQSGDVVSAKLNIVEQKAK
jgi:hypothetical protein